MDLTKYNKTYFEVINERFSCREFTLERIKTDEVEAILEAARLAPTACNFQPQRIFVVENEALLEKLKEATKFTFNAKTLFVVCYDDTQSYKRRNDNKEHGDIDATIVATHMMLACDAIGLGSCFVASFKEDILKAILSIPANYHVTCLLPVGYPKEIKDHNERNDVGDFVFYK